MYGLVAQLGERTVRIREVRGFDPLQVHFLKSFEMLSFQGFVFISCLFCGDFVLISIFVFPAYPYIYPNWAKKRRKTALFRAV